MTDNTKDIQLNFSDEGVVIDSTEQNIKLSYDELRTVGIQSREPDPREVAETVSAKMHTDVLSEFEITPDDEQEAFLGGLKLKNRVESQNAAMIDSTTFQNAVELLSGNVQPSSLRFFDLKPFVYAVVLFDEVYVTSDPSEPSVEKANNLIEDSVFKQLTPSTQPEDDFFYFLWNETAENLKGLSDEQKAELKRIWEEFLGDNVDDVGFDWSEADRWVESPPDFYENFDRNWRSMRFPERFITLSTFRTFYGHELARRLNLTYLPNSARGPVQQFIISNVTERTSEFDIVISELERKLEEDINNVKQSTPILSRTIEYRLPMFLSIVINRADTLDETFHVLSMIRDDAQPYRENIPELIYAVEQGDINRIEEIQNLLDDTTDKYTESNKSSTVSSILQTAPDIPILPGSGTETIVALKLLSGYTQSFEQYGRTLYHRIRKPHYYFLTNVREEARQFTSTKGAVKELWNTYDYIDFDMMERAELHYPYF